jgi:hypothetical protein
MRREDNNREETNYEKALAQVFGGFGAESHSLEVEVA